MKTYRINSIGKTRYILWKFEDKTWKILNKVFRANFYKLDNKPKWLSLKLYLLIRNIYKIRVERPYEKMIQSKIKEDFSKDSKLQKFEQYLK